MSNKTSILVLAANPKGTPSLRLDREVREIQSGLLRSGRKGFHIRQDWAVRPRDVRRSLLEHRPSIVHFCGHGTGEEGLVLEDDRGGSQLVSTSAVAGLFKLFSTQVRCVILNACLSEFQAKAIANHIEYVIGMSREIGDGAAVEFAIGFYDAIAAGESYESAFRFGCNAIELAGLPGNLIPVLYKNSDSNAGGARFLGESLTSKSLRELRALGWSTTDIKKRLERLDYDCVAGLDVESEGEADQWGLVAESNPDGYSFAVDRAGDIVGYWHFEALPGDLFARSMRGELEDGEITVDKITFLCAPGVIDIYFIIFAVEKRCRGFRVNRLLLDALFDRLEELAESGIYVRRVCANAFTPEGVGLCQSLGMKYLQPHRRAGLIYHADLRDSSLLRRARPQLSEALNKSTTSMHLTR